MSPTLQNLNDKMESVTESAKGVALIKKIAATNEPETIDVLASTLDIPGPIGAAAVKALIAIGDAVIPAMNVCIESDDADMIDRAHKVLAALSLATDAALATEAA